MAGIEPAVTIAICSNRPERLSMAVPRLAAAARRDDHLLIVFDGLLGDADAILTEHASPGRARLVSNETNRGLAYSRNRVMKECQTRHVIFVDDDVVIGSEVIEAIRASLARGAAVVGARVIADLGGRARPWHVTSGQLHYLGAHPPRGAVSIWGACMAVDIETARLLGVEFDEALGRVGATLCSAEDTTFVRAMVARGARQETLADASVRHLVDPGRLRLAYLVRRSYWQGRSEARRGDALHGLRKEWARNAAADAPSVQRIALAALYTASVIAGIAVELLRPGRSRNVAGPLTPPGPAHSASAATRP
ncbi:MAG TPA: glycosyltransferase [Streptosporangiaceae bacterium]|nr:glycosyltransferase [Streptosporangiaceae bacterium]